MLEIDLYRIQEQLFFELNILKYGVMSKTAPAHVCASISALDIKVTDDIKPADPAKHNQQATVACLTEADNSAGTSSSM